MSLPNPIGKQREVLALGPKGHFVVLGTAGSGKTTLAILRSSILSRTACSNNERVLLVTFNKALVTYLEKLSDGELDKVDVRNYHRFARGYLKSRGAIGRNDIVKRSKKIKIIEEVLELVKQEDDNQVYYKPPEVFVEEFAWIQGMGIISLDEYRNVTRVGRAGTRIKKSERPYYFRVYQGYIELRARYGYKYDWDDIAYFTLQELINDDDIKRYRHIIIDEGQDFSPVMLKSLVKTIPDGGSITFFGDVVQQIYGSRLTWRSAGLNPLKIWNFEENYRNTKEIASLGLAIAQLPFYKGISDMVEPKFPKASGPKPTLVDFKNGSDELNAVLGAAIDNSKTQTVAILLRDREAVRAVISMLNTKRAKTQELYGDMGRYNLNPGISVGTYHSAKGLEFDVVFMPFCNSSRLPDKKRVVALESIDEALAEEVRLIYVGVTRAKQRLLISYTGEMTVLLPTDDNLYRKVSR